MSALDEAIEIEKTVDLWSAVLEQAAADFLKLVTAKVLTTEAKVELWPVKHWLFEEAGHHVGSFLWACSVVQADPYEMRNRLKHRAKGGANA